MVRDCSAHGYSTCGPFYISHQSPATTKPIVVYGTISIPVAATHRDRRGACDCKVNVRHTHVPFAHPEQWRETERHFVAKSVRTLDEGRFNIPHDTKLIYNVIIYNTFLLQIINILTILIFHRYLKFHCFICVPWLLKYFPLRC